MPETLVIDGQEMSADEAQRAFAQAMAAPEPDEPLSAEPPKRRERKVGPSDEKPSHAKPRVTTTGKTAPGRPRKAAEPVKPQDFTEELTGLCQLAYGGLVATGQYADAGAVKTHGPGMVQAWNAVAQENQTVRKGLEFLTKGSAWGAVVVCTMPFALQIMANHGQVAVEKVVGLGVKNPDELEKETQRDIMVMAAMAEDTYGAASLHSA